MSIFLRGLIVYLIAMTVLILISIVVGDLDGIRKQSRDKIGSLTFLLAVYLLPLLILFELVDPGFLNELRPFLFKPTQFTILKGRRTDV